MENGIKFLLNEYYFASVFCVRFQGTNTIYNLYHGTNFMILYFPEFCKILHCQGLTDYYRKITFVFNYRPFGDLQKLPTTKNISLHRGGVLVKVFN